MKRDFNRYVVVKNSHAKEALLPSEHKELYRIAMKVAAWRRTQPGPSFECVVVEHDWPEYEPVWKMIEARVDGVPTVTRHAIGQGTVDTLLQLVDHEISACPNSLAVPENMITALAWLMGIKNPHLPIDQYQLYPLLGNGVYYMDPPDGGSPSLMTMLQRMAEDAAKYRELCK